MTKSLEDHHPAMNLPNGARFYRCALQVNPYEYLVRHNKPTRFKSEEDYNEAIINACREENIEVLAITDHYRVATSRKLASAARERGLWVFDGFEAVSKDGVHFLCLFDHKEDEEELIRILGACGIHDSKPLSPLGKYYSMDLLKEARNWGAMVIAAHATSKGGILNALQGQARIDVWKSPDLLACALPGPVDAVQERFLDILRNKQPEYERNRPMAVINSADINGPEDLRQDKGSCFIKMSEVSVEALRQAFLDPESRIRLHSDPKPPPHSVLKTITWEGGFLDGTSIHFNDNLNVLIGGRGTGKSTVVESIRYALDLEPIGDEARKTHQSVVRQVLQSGTKISLVVCSHHPTETRYIIERRVLHPPVVKSEAGKVLDIPPRDVLSGVQVFSQHEISELAGDPEKRTLFLRRFTKHDPSAHERKSEIRRLLGNSRRRILELHEETRELEERLSDLPGLEEAQSRFREKGIEKKLQDKSLLVREEKLFDIFKDRLEHYKELRLLLNENLPIDNTFVSKASLEGLPNAHLLEELNDVISVLNKKLSWVEGQFDCALSEASNTISKIKDRWNKQKEVADEKYEELLRELQKHNIDGTEFIEVKKRIEGLHLIRSHSETLQMSLDVHEQKRQDLLTEWKKIIDDEFQEIAEAARSVSKKLEGKVRIKVRKVGNQGPLEQLLRDKVGGNLAPAFDRFREFRDLSLTELSDICREGKEKLTSVYKLPKGAAERIAGAGLDLHMSIEEIELIPATQIELNTAGDASPNWQAIDSLSTGQKATAILLLLLLDAESPLVVDQPEDDLDNRFITEGIIPVLHDRKQQRQFIFSTHNANIPVLGDAELILGLDTRTLDDTDKVCAEIADQHRGSIDLQPVRELIEEILEGGKSAFETRREKYGF